MTDPHVARLENQIADLEYALKDQQDRFAATVEKLRAVADGKVKKRAKKAARIAAIKESLRRAAVWCCYLFRDRSLEEAARKLNAALTVTLPRPLMTTIDYQGK